MSEKFGHGLSHLDKFKVYKSIQKTNSSKLIQNMSSLFETYIIIVIFAQQTGMLCSFLLQTKVRKS